MIDPIRQFFACYFHQDWNLEYSNYVEAIDDFCLNASVKDLCRISLFVQEFLDSGTADNFDIRQYGGYYIPEADGLSKEEFLLAIKNAILIQKNKG